MGTGRNARRHTMFESHRETIVSRSRARREPSIFGDTSPQYTMRCSASCDWENGYIRNWTPSSSRDLTDPSRFQPRPEIARCWEGVHSELLSRFTTLSSTEWLE